MKRFLILLVALFGITKLSANLNYAIDYAIFQDEKGSPYVEFYLSINGNSISYAEQENSLFRARMEITYLIEQGDKVLSYEKKLVQSPLYEIEDFKLDLMDIERLPLQEGQLTYTVIIQDLITGEKSEYSAALRPVQNKQGQLSFSEIELSNDYKTTTEENKLSKNGFEITPNIAHVYNLSKPKLVAYMEVYDADKSLGEGTDYLIDIKVVHKASRQVRSNLRALKKIQAKPVSPVIQAFDITKLPSGEYSLLIEAKNRNNEIIASQSNSFLRINPATSNIEELTVEGTFVDTINDVGKLTAYIKCLSPISTNEEDQWAINQIRYGDLENMQKFFLNFWTTRNQLNPGQEWMKYKEKVDFVDEKFGYGNVNGYTTERGRVYLQYGAPSTVQNVPFDRGVYPYSVWQYNQLNNMTNRKFIFYSPSMEMLGYEVLHSNVPGEKNNADWQIYLNKRSTVKGVGNELPDNAELEREAKDLFDNPR